MLTASPKELAGYSPKMAGIIKGMARLSIKD